ncbi:ran-binding protein 3 [Coccinella septempunctata]|uniref:ran-binding protein 3 n=1 Tax=Coccinella septempunctata TaxID=41139 RepID=UPI001D093953|nr:ran-binding protein 3 [Coccinella septempunctata]
MAESEKKSVATSVIIKVEDSSPETSKMTTENKIDEIKTLNPSSRSLPKSAFSIALKPSILRPPQLNLESSNFNSGQSTKAFKLSPPKLNAFTKQDDNIIGDKIEKTNGEIVKASDSSSAQTSVNVVPAKSNITLNASTLSSTSFIFGQNLKDRVIAAETENNDSKPSTSLSTNGSTDMLFSDGVKPDIKSSTSSNSKENKSLVETAREYEESRAVKRKYEEVEVKTGEEDETNILCMSCKLFSFDGTSGSWQERGRGTLRLNDFETDDRTQSRLVFRTSGSLRVILNTKVFSSMTAEKASDKSIRLTALDANGEIKIFLVMASVEDSKALQQHLEHRIKMEIEACKKKKSQ